MEQGRIEMVLVVVYLFMGVAFALATMASAHTQGYNHLVMWFSGFLCLVCWPLFVLTAIWREL